MGFEGWVLGTNMGFLSQSRVSGIGLSLRTRHRAWHWLRRLVVAWGGPPKNH